MIDHDFARALAATVGMHRLIAAVDSRGGRVCIHGWKTVLPLTAVQAVQLLEGYCEEFLYTHVDKEGLMQGTDMAAITAVAKATERKLTAAGGITTREEIDALDAHGHRRRGRHGDLHRLAGAGVKTASTQQVHSNARQHRSTGQARRAAVTLRGPERYTDQEAPSRWSYSGSSRTWASPPSSRSW